MIAYGALAACYASSPGEPPPDGTPSTADAVSDGLPDSSLGNASFCAGDGLVSSDAEGHISSVYVCHLGCNVVARRCNQLQPSNGFGQAMEDAASARELSLVGAATIDTDAGTVTDASGLRAISAEAVTVGVPVALFVLKVRSFATGGDVAVKGARGLVILSAGPVAIDHVLSVSASAQRGGPGSIPNDPACRGATTVRANVNGWAGAGGGGFGTPGGSGGAGGSPPIDGGAGGGTAGAPALVPLRGGCRGGRDLTSTSEFTAGGGGGAIQITSRSEIVLGDGGVIAANGAGGGKFQGLESICEVGRPCGHADGGGAGGGILLEATSVVVNPRAGLFANGGGGGCGDGRGQAGELSTAPARGAGCTGDVNSGGIGAAASAAAGGGGAGTIATPVGGGGGGGAGRIRVNVVAASSFAPSGIVSGVFTTGLVEIR